MPWGWECRSRLVKQNTLQPTKPKKLEDINFPGPGHYDQAPVVGGKGYSRIKRAPAYTFGLSLPVPQSKPAALPRAPLFNIQGLSRKGCYRITHSVVTPHIEDVQLKQQNPGPAGYLPRNKMKVKRAPDYSIQPPAKPLYQPWDMWTPSANMYWPPIPGKKAPAYSLGNVPRDLNPQLIPGPGEHDPKFDYVKKSKPAYSFGYPFSGSGLSKTPAPNTYCERKFNYVKSSLPAHSFGIRHTPYLGKFEEYLKSSELDLIAAGDSGN